MGENATIAQFVRSFRDPRYPGRSLEDYGGRYPPAVTGGAHERLRIGSPHEQAPNSERSQRFTSWPAPLSSDRLFAYEASGRSSESSCSKCGGRWQQRAVAWEMGGKKQGENGHGHGATLGFRAALSKYSDNQPALVAGSRLVCWLLARAWSAGCWLAPGVLVAGSRLVCWLPARAWCAGCRLAPGVLVAGTRLVCWLLARAWCAGCWLAPGVLVAGTCLVCWLLARAWCAGCWLTPAFRPLAPSSGCNVETRIAFQNPAYASWMAQAILKIHLSCGHDVIASTRMRLLVPASCLPNQIAFHV
ncbi:hypothetical protein MRX96_029563 [Rhipicephalus microplus]